MISLFVTGLGPITPALPDGAIVPIPIPTQIMTVQVTFMPLSQPGSTPGTLADILYAGPAPLELEGLGQINLRVPTGTGSPITFRVVVLSPDGKESFSSPGALLWIE